MKNLSRLLFTLVLSSLIFSALAQTYDIPIASNDSVVRITVSKIKKVVVTVPPVDTTTPPPVNGSLIYSNNFDKAADINSNQLGAGGLSTTIYKNAPGSFRSEVPANADQISNGWRSEQQYPESYSPDNTEIIYEYDILFESLPDVAGLAVQFHGNTKGTSGQLAMWINGGKFMVMRNTIGTAGSDNIYQPGPLMTIQLNHWYHFKWEVKFTSGNTGYVRCFIDNSLYYSVTGKTSDGSGQYLKVGQNLFAKPKKVSRLYVDNLRIYK